MPESTTPKLDDVNTAIKNYNELVKGTKKKMENKINNKLKTTGEKLKLNEEKIKTAEKTLRDDPKEGKIPVQLGYRSGALDPTNTGTEFLKILQGTIESETEFVKQQIRAFVDTKISTFYTTQEKLIQFQEQVLNFKKEVNRIFKEDVRSDTKTKIKSGGSVGGASSKIEYLQNKLTQEVNDKKQYKINKTNEYNQKKVK